ncbi:MAG: hypothetical protein M3Z21_05750 [Pseudomonadota bacterium]|nr:hypothetical protein [Pseudomonadota bacterium]
MSEASILGGGLGLLGALAGLRRLSRRLAAGPRCQPLILERLPPHRIRPPVV